MKSTRNEERATIRKLILSAVFTTGTITGLTATADAAPPVGFDRDRNHDRHNVRFYGRAE